MTPSSPLSAFDLTDKVAVVTGGSRGLGRAMVEAFAAHGADVVIASRKVEACQVFAAEVSAATGRQAIGIAYHAGRWEDADRLASRVYDHFGRCDVLVNNAGVSPTHAGLTAVSQDLFDKVLEVNLRGPFRLSALVGERMAADEGGSIIHVSSIAAVQPTKHELVYGAAKAGVNALSAGLARAYAPKVRSNVIMPGPFLTDMSKAWDMREFEGMAREAIALQRGGEAREIVGAALYLASAASSFTTGAVIKIDGGFAYASG